MAGAKPLRWSDTMDATEEVQKITQEAKAQREKKKKTKYYEFNAVQYRTHPGAGTNYLIKVHAGLSSYLHLLVHQKPPCDGGAVRLIEVEEFHRKDDPLVPF